jgi:hypothetical protein
VGAVVRGKSTVNKLPIEGSHFNGEPRMSKKLLIDFWDATVSAEGIYAIGAAVIMFLVWRVFR